MALLLFCICCVVLIFPLILADIWFLNRIGLVFLYATFWQKRPKDIFQTLITPNVVLTSDLDYMWHMNNARYLREADIARLAYFARYRFPRPLGALRANTVLSASSSRHRRPLSLFERFDIRTQLLGWDDHALYLEQRFVSRRKDFVVAIIHCRHHVTGTTPAALMEAIARKKVESPELPEEVKHWLKYNEASSQRLRAESNMQKNSKDQ